MVEHDLAKVETRVRFPYPALKTKSDYLVAFCFLNWDTGMGKGSGKRKFFRCGGIGTDGFQRASVVSRERYSRIPHQNRTQRL